MAEKSSDPFGDKPRAEPEIIPLAVEETQIKLKTKRALIFSRLIEGHFPDYEAVVPSNLDKKVSFQREALA